jgi:hypothetical protein
MPYKPAPKPVVTQPAWMTEQAAMRSRSAGSTVAAQPKTVLRPPAQPAYAPPEITRTQASQMGRSRGSTSAAQEPSLLEQIGQYLSSLSPSSPTPVQQYHAAQQATQAPAWLSNLQQQSIANANVYVPPSMRAAPPKDLAAWRDQMQSNVSNYQANGNIYPAFPMPQQVPTISAEMQAQMGRGKNRAANPRTVPNLSNDQAYMRGRTAGVFPSISVTPPLGSGTTGGSTSMGSNYGRNWGYGGGGYGSDYSNTGYDNTPNWYMNLMNWNFKG